MKQETIPATGEAVASIDAEVVLKIARHHCHAKIKHPYFADKMFFDENNAEEAKANLGTARMLLRTELKQGEVYAETLVKCELTEICDALARGDKAHAVEECYDTIAVLLRMVDVLEGRQALGKPNESEAAR